MTNSTLSIYNTAWNMHQAGSTIYQICKVVSRHRATIYRWISKIKQIGIKEFIRRKSNAKYRRPSRKTPEYIVQKIVDIRNQYGWCGAKIKKELRENHHISLALSTIYRHLHYRFTNLAVRVNKYHKHQALTTANAPREVIEHDTVDLGGKSFSVYAYTAIDIFTKEPSVVIANNLSMDTGTKAFLIHNKYYGKVITHQSDNGSEFQSSFKEAVRSTGANHRYSRPYKKNEQSHIENFNKALRSECFPKGDYSIQDIPKLQKLADQFTKHYINRRWHMGLPDMMTPA